ncbi:MAG: phosphatidylserine decarboxylase [Planctomycetota bacterium]
MTKYARVEIALTLLVGGTLTLVVGWVVGWWALLPAVLTFALLSFYRDPPRRIPPGANLVLAPADGRIVEVTRNAAGPDGGAVARIMIFLSVHNVHVNRSPCAGRVLDTVYKPGQFVNALRAEADRCNECNTIVLEPAAPLPGPIRVRQIAGVLARRIVCAVRPGDVVAAGERVGMIKLGSRTEVSLPEHSAWEILVANGDKVRGGATPLARLRPETP